MTPYVIEYNAPEKRDDVINDIGNRIKSMLKGMY